MATRAIVYFAKSQPYNRSAAPALTVSALLKGHDGYPEYPGMGSRLFGLLECQHIDNADLEVSMTALASFVKTEIERVSGSDVQDWTPAPFAKAREAGADYIYVVSPARTDTTKLHLKIYEVGQKITRIYSGRLDSFYSVRNERKAVERDRVAA